MAAVVSMLPYSTDIYLGVEGRCPGSGGMSAHARRDAAPASRRAIIAILVYYT
jgi:hypothetical protein